MKYPAELSPLLWYLMQTRVYKTVYGNEIKNDVEREQDTKMCVIMNVIYNCQYHCEIGNNARKNHYGVLRAQSIRI